ncbi:CBS domain-containing protein [Streptomyces mobaraensis]|uniref:CBS domain-containing protein n=1 Tax=Streptomyces mobaraensis TaxID=35621 RepID=A0A5N5VZX6_STRMB|nr:CBS domain-containing protein [Streptomyces mobaraensis]KAB7833883.1 CBS domain-containing protein [Streptomyces mobaraensis]
MTYESHGPRTVGDVMTRTVVAVGRRAVYKEIVKTLAEWRVGTVPVLAGEGRVVGVVSRADLLSREEFRDEPGREVEGVGAAVALGRHGADGLAKAATRTAEDLMSAPAVTVRGDATVAEAARIMARARVKTLPVVDAEGRLAGIVSRGDLLTVYLREDEDIAAEIRTDVVAPLFPHRRPTVDVRVDEGVVTLSGAVPDSVPVPLVIRLVRAVGGVVDVDVRPAPPVAR